LMKSGPLRNSASSHEKDYFLGPEELLVSHPDFCSRTTWQEVSVGGRFSRQVEQAEVILRPGS